jgi:hypothetical protein
LQALRRSANKAKERMKAREEEMPERSGSEFY